MHLNSLFTLAFCMLGLTAAVRKRQTPPPAGETYVTARPACNISGFTETPGNYVETIYQESGATLESCMDACRHNKTCKSIAYADVYTECLFYDHHANQIQLWEDSSSDFDHFDKECDVCKYDE